MLFIFYFSVSICCFFSCYFGCKDTTNFESIKLQINNLIKIVRQDSYISMIIAFILGFIPLLFIYYIFNYEPSLSLPKKNLKLFGNILGTIINIIIIWFTFFIILILFSNLVTFIFN